MPIRAESHQPPGRAPITGSGGAQMCRSVDRDSQMSARPVSAATGRWNRMKSPPIRRGSSAPFLSSGARTMPSRSTLRKSCGGRQRQARAAGPERGVGDDPRVQLLDPGEPGVLQPPGLVTEAGIGLEQRLLRRRPSSRSRSRDRATVRWLSPRRSSTRQSSTVVPSTSAAPAFITALTVYGQRLGVSSGLPR